MERRMQAYSSAINAQKLLLLSIILVGFIIIFATLLGKESAKIVTDIIYIPVTGVMVALSFVLSFRFRGAGNHGKAWLFFLGTTISWFIAETIWTIYELVYNINPFPSLADVFFLIGYPLIFCFLMYYLKPVKKGASRKIILGSILVSVAILVPSIYMAYNFDPNVGLFENILATSYPVADSIILVPALVGVVLFFKGEVNFTWSLICLGIVLQSVGDTCFQYATFTNTYYSGHPS
ncbi:MAG TPA: hypothetical protein VEJ68_00770, partial [Candidatus Bathyarchaeia archaeon]|nr:hypothetical protein [Candidatus Bathyarchaeia archaeon]